MKDGFEFQHPWVLVFLALLPLYAFVRGRAGAEGALRFSSVELVRAIGGRVRSMAGRLFIFLRTLTVALTIIAMAGPRWVNEQTETQASGVDIMLVFDLSWSMMALDMAPPGKLTTRFDIAQSVLKDFVARRPSDRIGLIAFSGVPYLVSPPTLNHEWLQKNLDRLYIGVITELGTAIGDATGLAVKRLSAQKQSRGRLIVLLTDGDNNKWETLEPIASASLAAGERVRVYTVGVGKNEQCWLPDFDRETGKLRLGLDGKPSGVITMLQPANYVVLEKMSKMTGGKSYTATNRQELDTVYADIDRLEKTEVKLKHHRTYTPLFHIPLLGVFAVLLLELLLANTRFRRIP
ncbi:aerotolerance regulator BatA [Verrucomicrobiota bacterium]|nr:aerotolerance regulator BatA [Verrucomicrobiota bacterium]